MKLTDEDQEWLRSRGPTGHEADVAAAIARGYERGKADAVAAYPKEYFARCDERNAAEDAQAKAEADRDRLAKRCEDLEWQAQKAPIRERSDRLAALEQRVGALVEALLGCFGPDGAESYGEMAARLAALRAPGVGADDRCRRATQRLVEIAGADGPMSLEDAIEWAGGKVEALESALATARRERDEAVSVVRRCAVGLGDPCKRDCSHDACWVISEARALVAGQGEDPRQNLTAECEMWKDQARDAEQLRSDRAARDAEIAGLKVRAEKAEANYAFMVKRAADEKLDGYRELGARAAAAESAADALRARIAELEARDRKAGHALVGVAHRIVEGRSCWCLGEYKPESGHTLVCRMARALVVSEEAHPDPARGLIERCLDAVDGRAMALRADLRAYLGGGT